jgi:histidyl-tRNA synthetase
MVVEAEIIAAAGEALVKLGFDDFTIRLNHRQALTGILTAAGVPLEIHDAALVALDKLDKIGRDKVQTELTERGVGNAPANTLLDFFADLASLEDAAQIAIRESHEAQQLALNSAIVGRLVEFVGSDEIGARGIDELQSILHLCAANGSASRIRIDPGLARGLSYYTGAIIEINVKDLAGSLGGGGRYDGLVGMFLGQDVPACGFSLGLERIIVVMAERGMFPPALLSAPADLMVTIWNEDTIEESVVLASELRRESLRVDLYPEADKLGKQFKHASARGIPFVVILGDEERARGEVALKDMRSGDQKSVKRENIASVVRQLLAES